MKTEASLKKSSSSAAESKNEQKITASQRLKNHFSFQFKRLRSEGSVIEFIFWVVSTALMIYTIYHGKQEELAPSLILAVTLNTLATVAVPVFAMIFPRSFFLGRLTARTQTYFDILVISGSFFCYGYSMYKYIAEYDKWQHFISGFLVVFLGAELLKTFFPKKKIEPVFGLIGGTGLSFAIIVIWELFEFTADFFIAGSTNQGYNYGMDEKLLFIKIFGHGAGNEGQYPLFDTIFDMMAATVGIAAAAVLYIVIMKIKEKKGAKKSAQA